MVRSNKKLKTKPFALKSCRILLLFRSGFAEQASQPTATSGRNLWISGLSSSTRAADLKTLFSKHGKVHELGFNASDVYSLILFITIRSQVAGAKVVTNARSPMSKCYGFVTMNSTEEASTCIKHLHRTELHGKIISVERVRDVTISN